MLIMSNIGDQVWLITSRQTEPELEDAVSLDAERTYESRSGTRRGVSRGFTYSSSMFGWKIRFTKPMLGDLYGYWSGSSTWTFHKPPEKGAGQKELAITSQT